MAFPAVSNLIKRIPFGVAIAFALAWCTGSAEGLTPLPGVFSYPFYESCFMCLFFVAIAVWHTRLTPFFTSRKTMSVVGMLGIICVAVQSLTALGIIELSWGVLLFCTTVLSAVIPYAFIVALIILSHCEMLIVMCSLTVWQITVSICVFASSLIESPLWNIVFLVVAFALLLRARAQAPIDSDPRIYEDGLSEEGRSYALSSLPLRLITIDALLVFFIHIVRTATPASLLILSHIGSVVTAVMVIVLIMASGTIIRMRPLYQASIVILVLTLVGYALSGSFGSPLPAILADASYTTFSVFFFTVLCNICLRYHVSPVLLFALTYAAECFAQSLGIGLTTLLDGNVNQTHILALIVFSLAVIAFAFFSTDEDYSTAWGTNRKKQGLVDPATYYHTLSELCTTVSMQYGLSKRESDVLLLLAQNKSAADIAEDLFVSQATVKSHTHNIYRKLDIHSKKELFTLLGRPTPNDFSSN